MSKITTGQMFEQWEQMNQKLEALDNKIDGIIDGTTPANTQVTGSIVEKDIMLNRGIYNSNTVFNVNRPNNRVKGFRVISHVNGVTGSFDDGQGISLQVQNRFSPRELPTWNVRTTKKTSSNILDVVMTYPGLTKVDENAILPNREQVNVDDFLADKIWAQLIIDGNFQAGEGFDCQVSVEWLY